MPSSATLMATEIFIFWGCKEGEMGLEPLGALGDGVGLCEETGGN